MLMKLKEIMFMEIVNIHKIVNNNKMRQNRAMTDIHSFSQKPNRQNSPTFPRLCGERKSKHYTYLLRNHSKRLILHRKGTHVEVVHSLRPLQLAGAKLDVQIPSVWGVMVGLTDEMRVPVPVVVGAGFAVAEIGSYPEVCGPRVENHIDGRLLFVVALVGVGKIASDETDLLMSCVMNIMQLDEAVHLYFTFTDQRHE